MEKIELSYSKIQAYQRCPWLYHLVYQQGWREGPKASQAFGNSIHQTLDHYVSKENTTKTLDRLYEILDQQWVNEGYATTEETLASYNRARTLLKKFFETSQKESGTPFATEKNFSIEMDPIQFRGTVDRIDHSPDKGYILIEYKTHGKTWGKDRIDQDLQMTFYQWGIEQGLGLKSLKLKYYFLSTGDVIETHRTPKQREQAIQLIKDVGDKIQKQIFTPNHDYCGRCEFQKRCVKVKR